jgi:hypothetical protein
MGDFIGHFVVTTTHETLYRHDRVHGVRDRLSFGGIPDLSFPVLEESNDGRGRPAAFVIGDDNRLIAFHYGYATIRGAKVNSDYFSHINRFIW